MFDSIICPRSLTRVIKKSVIYLELLSCYLVVIFDDIFLRQ